MSITAQLSPDLLASRVETLIGRRQFNAASKLISAIAALAPDRPLATLLGVRLALAEARLADAIATLDDGLLTWPRDCEMLRLRAGLALEAGDPVRAAITAADAVIEDRNDAPAKSILGRALLILGRTADAAACLQEAVAANPQDVPAILALAEALPGQAAPLLAAAIARMPQAAVLRTSLLRVLIAENEAEAASHAAAHAAGSNALDPDGFLLAGHASAMLHDWEQAREYWHQALRLVPRDPSASYRLAAEQARREDRLDPAMIAAADDAHANLAEPVMLAGGTILPGRVRAAFSGAAISGPVLDLGCGTGLCAIASLGLPGLSWEGAELSPALAAIARSRPLYQAVHEADPLEFLDAAAGRWQGISFNFVAGLTARLSPLFTGLAAHLLPGGLAVGAIVVAPDDRFGPFCCFEHGEGQICEAARASGLALDSGPLETLMTIDGLPLRGRVVTLSVP